MRAFGHFLLIGILGAVSLRAVSTPTPQAQPPARDANAILAQAREALGGEKRLSAVKNFIATGRTRQVRGENLVPIEFEIAVELPDKYVRKDEIPAQESGPTSTGFNGNELIQLPVPTAPTPPPAAAGREGAPPAPNPAQQEAMRAARVAGVKQDFVRLTLGMFAGSFSSYPLTFTYVGQAEAPQGKADVLEGKAPPNFTVRLFVNSETHLPIMVSWQAAAGRGGPGRGGPGGPGGPGAAGGPGAGPTAEGRGAPSRAGAPPAAAPGGTGERGAAPAQPPARPPETAGAPAAAGAAPPQGAAPAAAGATPAPGAARGQAPTGAPPQGAGAPGQQPPGSPAGAAGPGRSGTPPAQVEYRIYYADYRDVDGMQWPFRLRRATGTETTEETTFDRFRVNTKIDPKKFEVRK